MQSPNPSTLLRRYPVQFAVIASSLLASVLPAQESAAKADASKEEIVELTPFQVSTQKDYGYRASNSISGTRTNTAIKDVPMNIQVFTKDIYDDLVITDQTSLEAYSPSIVNDGSDAHSDNVIQQAYQAMIVRGFRQNWFLRDGVREYDPVDGQNIARTEVVKGPSSVLYGLAYAGGVTQLTTKEADMLKNFAEIRLTFGGQGDYRATADANVVGTLKSAGKIGIRVNSAYAQTQDERAHSKGLQRLQAVTATWAPFPTTQAQVFFEQGFRGQPNGLGYFTRSETGVSDNRADIPLQITHPEIPWTWNWSNGKNLRSLDTKLIRGQITQSIGDSFSVKAYYTYESRVNKDGDGWDANGSGGADAWEYPDSGWVTENGKDYIKSTYHYRDWSNDFHSYGATAVYKFDIDAGSAGKIKNVISFGGAAWAESELSRESHVQDGHTNPIYYEVKANIPIPVPNQIDSFVVAGTDGGPNGNGYQHENNSNDFYFLNWNTSSFENKLKTSIGVNKTNIRMIHWNNGTAPTPSNDYKGDKVSPMVGVTYDVTKDISLFGLYSTSLFPDSSKDSRGNQFSPFNGKSYEVGVKISTADEKFSGTVSYYQITQDGGTQTDSRATNATTDRWDRLTQAERDNDSQFKNRQRSDFLGDTVAGGEQEGKGFDLDLIYQPIRNWQIVLGYAHNKHEFTKSAAANTIGQTYPGHTDDRFSVLTKYSFIEGPAKGAYAGIGVYGGSKKLAGYVGFGGKDVARYTPAQVYAELFAGYKFKFAGYQSSLQLNVKNLTKTSDYVGWKATGSSSILSTERYAVPTAMVYRLTWGFDL